MNFCLGFRDQNEDAARLVREMELENCQVEPVLRMYRNGQLQALDSRVFVVTSVKICGF